MAFLRPDSAPLPVLQSQRPASVSELRPLIRPRRHAAPVRGCRGDDERLSEGRSLRQSPAVPEGLDGAAEFGRRPLVGLIF